MRSLFRAGSRTGWVLLVSVVTAGLLGILAPSSAAADAPGSLSGEVAAKPAKYREFVVVSLEKVPGSFRPPVQPITLDQKGMKFEPHVLAVMRGSRVKFMNNDNVRHNIFTPDGDKYNLGTWGQGESQDRLFATSGVYRQLCNVHPEMEGFIVVLDNPFFAVTAADGRFHIDNVPPGTYALRTWSEKMAPATQQVTVNAGAATAVRLDLHKP